MPQKNPCLLLDANAIFEAYRYGVWQAILDAHRVVIPSSVVHNEAQFYVTRDDCRRKEIDLPVLVRSGHIIEWVGSVVQIAGVRARFNQVFAQGLDPGETEALACLLAGDEPDALMVTADRNAILAVAMLGMPECAICLEEVLKNCGHTQQLPREHTAAFFNRCLDDGNRRFVTREGLA